MKSILAVVSLGCCTLLASHSNAQEAAVNAMCPIGKEPVVPSAGQVDYKGNAIGVCCPGCGDQFLSWDETRKDEFVTLAVGHRESGMEEHGNAADAILPDASTWTGPYTLATCPVTSAKLGSMGDPIVKEYDGREVRFCCSGCIGKFEADQAGYWTKIDKEIVKDQNRYYSTQTCVVSGEPLVDDGEDIAKEIVYGNRLIRLCCNSCVREFKADPKQYIDKLDMTTADAQRVDYPLETCVVAGGKLGSMGDPVEMVVAGRLVRLCCAGCKPKVEADPVKFIKLVDEAWQEQGRFMPEEHASGLEPR